MFSPKKQEAGDTAFSRRRNFFTASRVLCYNEKNGGVIMEEMSMQKNGFFCTDASGGDREKGADDHDGSE